MNENKMKAVIVSKFGDPEVLKFITLTTGYAGKSGKVVPQFNLKTS